MPHTHAPSKAEAIHDALESLRAADLATAMAQEAMATAHPAA